MPPEEKIYRALVLDDDEDVRILIRDHLLSYGLFDVQTFDDSREVYEHIEDGETYDIGIFDINLPGIDGITLARRLRRGLECHMPVLFVSGSIDTDREKMIQMMGCGYSYLEKPVRQKSLFESSMQLIKDSKIPVELGAVKKQVREGFDKINKKLDVLRPAQLIGLIEAEVCEARHSNEITEDDLTPGSLFQRWKKNPFLWAIILLVGYIGTTMIRWGKDTYDRTIDHDKRLAVQERVSSQISEQNKVLNTKVDKILDSVNGHGGGGS